MGAMPDATETDPTATSTSTPPAGEGAPPSPPAEPPTPPAPNAGGDDLGEAGIKALESERKARRDAEALAKRQEAELEKLRTAQLDDNERALKEARDAGRTEALTSVNRKLVEAEARAAAAGKLANPALAARLLDLDRFVPSDGSDIDGDAIVAAIDELVAAEPYLGIQAQTPPAAGETPPPAPKGTVTPGAQSGTPATFKRSQLRDPQFYAANKDAILKAASEGRIEND